MLYKLHTIAHNRWYWLAMATLGTSFIAVALYYQYVLEILPCVLCIHTRIWVSVLTLAALLALTLSNRWVNIMVHLLIVVCAVGLLERAYQLLGTERGFIFRDCGFDLGLPTWLALDEWLPAMFRVETTCGYTPELVLGITMAEALLVFSVTLIFVSLTLSVTGMVRQHH